MTWFAEQRARIDAKNEAARSIAKQGERPVVFDCADGNIALIARHPQDREWRLFIFDNGEAIGDYGTGFHNCTTKFESLCRAAIRDFGAIAETVRNARDEF